MKNNYMSDEMFGELMTSMKEAVAITNGKASPSRTFSYSPLNVKEIRETMHKNQSDFADMIGVKLGTLQNWEQGRRKPVGPALSLLKVVAANPEYVAQVLRG